MWKGLRGMTTEVGTLQFGKVETKWLVFTIE